MATKQGTAEAFFSGLLAIGRQGNAQSTGEYWNGLIDELSIYNRVLSPSEIQSLLQRNKLDLGHDHGQGLQHRPDLIDHGREQCERGEHIHPQPALVRSWPRHNFEVDCELGRRHDSDGT